MVTFHYGSVSQPGSSNIFGDDDSSMADFDATADTGSHTITAEITNIMLHRGWTTTTSGSATFAHACNVCSATSDASGGDEGSDQTYPLPPDIPAGKELHLHWSFNAYTIKDQFKLVVVGGGSDGAHLADTGCISTGDAASDEVVVPAGATAIRVVVVPNCAGETGTNWDYSITCTLEDIPAP